MSENKVSDFGLEDILAYKVSKLNKQLSDSLATAYAHLGVSVPQWRVIAVLGEHHVMKARDIADATQLDKVKVSRTISQLHEKNVVATSPSEHDGRTINISLTPTGSELHRQILSVVANWQATTLDKMKQVISDDELQLFVKVIDKILQ